MLADTSNLNFGMSYLVPTPDLAIEYVTCDPISTCLLNALQYTLLVQLFAVGLYMLASRVIKKGPRALFDKKTYMNIFEHAKKKRPLTLKNAVADEPLSDSSAIKGDEPAGAIELQKRVIPVSDDAVEASTGDVENPPIITIPSSIDGVAQLLLRNAAPKSQYRLTGNWARCFIFWYLSSSAAMFSALFWYYIEGGCSAQKLIIPNNVGRDYILSNFEGNGRHICSSKLSRFLYVNHLRRLQEISLDEAQHPTLEPTLYPTFMPTTVDEKTVEYYTPCVLDGLTCADYGGMGTSQCDGTPCDDRTICSRQTLTGSVMLEYTTCLDTPTALMTAIQFTAYAETVVLAIFFLVQLVSKNGFSILFDARTYFELWNK